MENVEAKIASAMAWAGADKFWIGSAIGWIRSVLSGNGHFVTDIEAPKVKVKYGYVARFECRALASIPDSGKSRKARIVYTFLPTRKLAHSARIDFA